MPTAAPPPESWKPLLAKAWRLFEHLEASGFGAPPFSIGGRTVLMFRFRHRVSKDIDFFGYDAQWLTLLSPRLNDFCAAMANDYSEQANNVKIMLAEGDIDFIIAGDVATPVARVKASLLGREIETDPTSEILAKKLFYRAASLKARDIYDLAAAIDLDRESAIAAVHAAATKREVLLRRIAEFADADERALRADIIAYEGALPHADGMTSKVHDFVARHARETRP